MSVGGSINVTTPAVHSVNFSVRCLSAVNDISHSVVRLRQRHDSSRCQQKYLCHRVVNGTRRGSFMGLYEPGEPEEDFNNCPIKL